MKQGLESALFKQYFADWDALQAAAMASVKVCASTSAEAGIGPAPVDVAALAAGGTVEEPTLDDGSGTKKVCMM